MSDMISLIARADVEVRGSLYGYIPSTAPCAAYIAMYSLATLAILFLAIKHKYWIAFVTLVPGGLLEILGWAARLWSHSAPRNFNPFLMQTCTLILGPAFFSAWAYTILGFCITRLGSAYSLLKPKWYLIIFVIADIVSLVLQAIGGGQAAVAARNGRDTKPGTKIMLAGILFQLATMTIFVILAIDFITRVLLKKPWGFLHRRDTAAAAARTEAEKGTVPGTPPIGSNEASDVYIPLEARDGTAAQAGEIQSDPRVSLKKVQLLLAGVAFASAMIFVRNVYRAIELNEGWTGYLITHEDYFTYLDGLPMTLCIFSFVFAWPGWLLPRRRGWKTA